MGIQKSDVFPSKYIASSDIAGRELRLTIQAVQMEELADGEQKAVMYFDKGTKGMIVNVTNWNTVEDAYGDDTDAWVGHPVILCTEPTTYKGKRTQGLRLKIPQAKPTQARPRNQVTTGPQPAPQTHDELDPPPSDDIPF
jgi:hypothetical protein